MAYDDALVKEIVSRIMAQCEEAEDGDIPVGVSNRHIHLSTEHLEILFGKRCALGRGTRVSRDRRGGGVRGVLGSDQVPDGVREKARF